MTRSPQQISSFAGGEISPKLRSRVTSQRYRDGAEAIENFIVHAQGGASRRMGFQDVGLLSEESIVIPFTQDDNDLDVVVSRARIEIYDGSTSLQLINTNVYENVANLDDLYPAQDENALEIVTDTVAPHTLKVENGVWSFAPSVYDASPTYAFNDSASPPATAGGHLLTFTGSWVAGNNFTLLLAGAETNPILWVANDETLRARIEEVLQQTATAFGFPLGAISVTAEGGETFNVVIAGGALVPLQVGVIVGQAELDIGGGTIPGGNSPTVEDVWSDARGWPRTVVYHEQRRIYGGTRSLPATIWASAVGTEQNAIFTLGNNNGDAFSFRIKSQKPMSIRWMSSKRLLALGTTGGDMVQFAKPFSPSNVDFDRQTANQSKGIPPVEANSETFYVLRGGRKVHNLLYDFGSQGWRSIDIAFPSEHLTVGKIRSMAWSPEPDGIMWCALESGELIAMTYERAQEVIAWHRHPFGGTCRSVAVVHRDGVDQVSMVVQENGFWRLVRLPATSTATPEAYPWIDIWARRTSPTPVNSIGGFINHEGREVRVMVDGKDAGRHVVSNGQVVVDEVGTVFEIGFDYIGRIKTNPYEGGAFGTSQVARRSWSNMLIRLIKSVLPKVNGEVPPDRSIDGTVMDEAQPFFTGDVPVEGTTYDDGSIEIIADRPGPCEVTGLFGVMSVGQG